MRYFLCIAFTVIVNYSSVLAQFNSDYKTVAKKKIKAATAFKFDEYGDSIFYRCTYDIKGRLVKTSYYGKNTGELTYSYSSSGMIVGFRSIFISPVEIGLPNPTRKMLRFDTASVYVQRFDANTGERTYNLSISYFEGKRSGGHLTYMQGDTTYDYRFQDNGFSLKQFTIKTDVDSLKRGYALTYYGISSEEYKRLYHTPDTCVGSAVYVVDKRGHTVRFYQVYAEEEPVSPVRQRDGTLYSPLNDSIAYLRLVYTYKNVYHKDGSLDYTVEISPWTKESKQYTNSIRNTPVKRIDSLTDVQEYGPTTFEYYE